jgi:peptidoglycan/LPS O-acetylase OafA/YrhL
MDSIKRLAAVEGLRGWLAWAVLFDHVAYFSNFRAPFLGQFLRDMGPPAVLVFIIVSGFVITHLLIERPEPYSAYLLRRFMRIFPLFAVTCIGGYFAYNLQVRLLEYDFGDQEFASVLRDTTASTDAYFRQHILAHITMLHGAISNNLLPFSGYAFNMPAWSISVEWQFYIVAPFVLTALVRRPLFAPLLAVLVGVGHWLFKGTWFGIFDQPGLLFGVAGYFAVGIASRLFYPTFAGKINNPNAVLASIIVLYGLVGNRPLAVWSIIYLGFLLHPSVNGIFVQAYRLALESRLATYFGSRSYSIYLSHFLVIVACEWLWIALFSTPPSFLSLLGMTIPATMATAEILYGAVELPGMKLGSRLARRWEFTASRPQRQSLAGLAPFPKGE